MMRTYSVVTGLHDKDKVPWIRKELNRRGDEIFVGGSSRVIGLALWPGNLGR